MTPKSRLPVVFLLIAAFVFTPFAAAGAPEDQLHESSPFNSFIDAILLRPAGLLLIPIGFCAFVISLPFSATGGNVSGAFDDLVKAPARYTFERPLGEIED